MIHMKVVQPIRNIDDIHKMKKALSSNRRNQFMFVFGIQIALRISDMLQLKVKDIKDQTHLIIKEGKTGKTRRQIISNNLRKDITEYTKNMKDDQWLFPSREGNQPISRIQAYRILNSKAKEIGLKEIGSHTLRKTFGFHFYQQTNDIVTLQKLFNHSSPEITIRYVGVNQDIMDEKLINFNII